MGRLNDEIQRQDAQASRMNEEALAAAAAAATAAEAAKERELAEGLELATEFVELAKRYGIPTSPVYTETVEVVELVGNRYQREEEVLIERDHFADCWKVAGEYIATDATHVQRTVRKVVEPAVEGGWFRSSKPERRFWIRSWQKAPLKDFMVRETMGAGDFNYTEDRGLFSVHLVRFLREHRS